MVVVELELVFAVEAGRGLLVDLLARAEESEARDLSGCVVAADAHSVHSQVVPSCPRLEGVPVDDNSNFGRQL